MSPGFWRNGIAIKTFLGTLLFCVAAARLGAAVPGTNLPAVSPIGPVAPHWLNQPLSLEQAINIALQSNADIARAQSDLEVSHGVAIQTRAIAIPKLRLTGDYIATDETETFPVLGVRGEGAQKWAADLRLVQSIYEGGRLRSALRSARLTREEALYRYQTAVADALLGVRIAYDDVLVAAQQIIVQEASVRLLEQEVADQKRRFDAGTVPRFNVLRAEVELANARPQLIRSRNAYRIAKNNLVNVLGFRLPKEIWEDIPLQLSGKLEAEPYDLELPVAIGKALASRSELGALREAERLRRESIVQAKSGYKPRFQLFAGYGGRNSLFSDNLARDIAGWSAGAEMNWDIFDGFLTKGKVQETEALHRKSRVDLEDAQRRIELDVRTAHSNFIEAKEVLESQKIVQEEAEEALRLARARSEAGTATQLDVLNAQTALTQARTTQIQALHDYSVARARLERATGQNIFQAPRSNGGSGR